VLNYILARTKLKGDYPTMKNTSLNRLVEDFNELPFEDKEYAVELIRKQLIEAKRDGIVIRAKEAMSNLKKGKVRRGSIGDLFRDLEND
jgi:hypothetical protein